MKKFLLIFLSLLILFIFFSLKSEFVLSQDPYPCPPGQDYCGDGCCDPDNGENSETCPDDCGEPSPCNNNGSCDGEEDCISCPLECGSCGYPCGCGDCETGQNAACDPDNPCITQLSCDQPDCHDTACWFSNCSGCGSGGPGCYCSTQSQCLACYTCICPIGDFDCTIRCNASNSTCYSECMDSSPGEAVVLGEVLFLLLLLHAL